MREKNNVWDQKRIEVKNKEMLIKHKDYQDLVPAQYKPKSLMSLQLADVKDGPNTTKAAARGNANQSSPTHSGKGSDLKKKGKASYEKEKLI